MALTREQAPARSSPFPRTWRQTAVLVPLARALRLYYRPRVYGLEAVPADRPVVYVAKHPRTWLYLETMLLALVSFWDCGRVPFRPMEKRGTSLHRLPGLAWVRRNAGTIEATEEAALAALAGGESVLVFPGGARELYGPPDVIDWRGRRGYARIAARAGVPVVPVAIAGADQQHPLRLPLGRRRSAWFPPMPLPAPLDYWFGIPQAPPTPDDPTALSAFADRVAAATEALVVRAAAERRKPWSLGGREKIPSRCETHDAVAEPGTRRPSSAGVPGRHVEQRREESARRRQAAFVAAGSRDCFTAPQVRSVEPGAIPPPIDPERWYYRGAYLPWARALSAYHRMRLEGPPPPRGPCIYVALHGAGYLVLDLVLAGYHLAWKSWHERVGTRTPLRIVAAESRIEKALPGLPVLKRHFGLIDPSEESCLSVLRRGEQLLVTPGGMREARPSGDFYRLRWEGRYGFVRLALETGAPIVPLAVVGGAEAYPGFRVKRLSFWSPLPLPARIDAALGEPIPVPPAPGRGRDMALVGPIHALARERTQALYDALLARREASAR